MIKSGLWVLVLIGAGWGQSSFLKPVEHGEMIYHETRGVSCASCHGRRAEGQIIALYPHNGQSVTLYAPPLSALTSDQVRRGLDRHSLAPRYHLSEKEIENLALFLGR